MKKPNFYYDSGFFNFSEAYRRSTAFNFIIGGRGTGKTYDSLRWAVESGVKFLFMRRLQKEAELISRDDLSPFRVYGDMFGSPLTCRPIAKYVTGVYKTVKDDEGNLIPTGPAIGMICALSSISNMRGFDTSDIDVIIFDEFIPEKSSNKQKYLGDALLNAYETINRNRELFDKPPVKLFALANSNDLGNDIFISLGMVNTVEKMSRKHQEFYQDRNRGITIIMLTQSKISEKKRQTALYKLTEGSEYAGMALANDFAYDDRFNIRHKPIREYVPLFWWGGITIYQHKSKEEYYVTFHRSGSPAEYTGEVGRQEARRTYAYIWKVYFAGRVFFENFDALRIFRKLFE